MKPKPDGTFPEIAFVVDADADNYDKADRYIKKLLAKFPELAVTEKLVNAPINGVTTVKVKRR
jgi:hypothetical protein